MQRLADVVEINTKEEQTFVEEFFSKPLVPRDLFWDTENAWLGVTDKEGKFVWEHGGNAVDAGYTRWWDGQQNGEACVALDAAKNWQWVTYLCNSRNAVLCESPRESGITG